MKTITLKLMLLTLFLGWEVCQAQDYSDLGRTRVEEFKILKFNGYKIIRIHSYDPNVHTFLAKRIHEGPYDNIISIDKATDRVIGIIWNFDSKNLKWIRSLLSDMRLADNFSTLLENNKGYAVISSDPDHQDMGRIIWMKK
jgi:hypothetical protein